VDRSAWGGARRGAGRRPLRLADLVAERRFDPRSAAHRRALIEDDELWLFLAGDERSRDLLAIQAAYRRCGGEDVFLADEFAGLVRALP